MNAAQPKAHDGCEVQGWKEPECRGNSCLMGNPHKLLGEGSCCAGEGSGRYGALTCRQKARTLDFTAQPGGP